MKKITLLFLALFLTIFLTHPAFASGVLYSNVNEYKSVNSNDCLMTNGCNACQTFMEFNLNWGKSAAVGGAWTNYVWMHPAVGGTWTIVGGITQYSGTYLIETSQGLYCASDIAKIEQQISSAGYEVSSYFTPTGGIQTLVNSAPSQIQNPSNAPLSGTALVPVVDMNFTKDPINIFSGEAFFSSTDFLIKGRGPQMSLSRHYRSFSNIAGMFGYGWRTDFDTNLSVDANGDVTIFDADGTGKYFMNYSGSYVASSGNYSTLIHNTDGSYTVTDKYGNMSQYGSNGRVMSHTDRNNNTLSFVYNPALVGGTYIQDASGREIKLYFDSNGHVVSAVDPLGRTFQYGYDTNSNLVSITDPTGAVTNYTYNSNHQITQFTNANGHNTYYQYDAQGRVIKNLQDNNVNQVSLNYQSNQTTVVTDSLGNNNTYQFNIYGLLTSQTDPLGNVTQKVWDGNMNLTSVTDARKNTTSYAYDYFGNLVQITDPLKNVTSMTYTPNFDLISSKTDAMGHVTNYVYDIKGNLTSIIDVLKGTHSYSYDQYGNVITATDTRGNATNYTYDTNSDVLQKSDALYERTNYTYDADGNILTQKDGRGNVTSFQYDNLNRLLKTTFANSSKVLSAYDLFGNQISVTDQRGNVLTKTYDPYERLIQTKDPLGGTTQFNYDTEGRLLTLTDANGHAMSYTYDPNGRMLTQSNALNNTTTLTYDPVGNVLSRTDANSKTTNYTYDALNRLTNTAYPDGTSIVNVYDALGRKTSMTDSTGKTGYTYDALSRLLTKTDPQNNVITYTYDSEGNRLTSIDQNNRTITNTYDAVNRLSTVTDVNGKTVYNYDAVSNKISVVSPNAFVANYTYDNLNRVLSIANEKAATLNPIELAVIVSSYTNVYDVAGMITQKTFLDGSKTAYTYDALNRLLSEINQKSSTIVYDYAYSYDAVGNRLTWVKDTTLGGFWKTDYLTMPSKLLNELTSAGYGNTANANQTLVLQRNYTNDTANRLTSWNYSVNVGSISLPIQTDSYTYDNNGNRISKQVVLTGQEATPQQTSYGYDFENRLAILSLPNVSAGSPDTLEFTYNGEGLRMQSSLDNVATNYLYDGSNVLVERNTAGTTTKSYTRGLDNGGGIGSLIAQKYTANGTSVTQYYDYNDQGTVANLTYLTGISSINYNYDAFGNLLTPQVGSDTNTHLFSTKELDAKSGLYYFGRRYYDPEVGRWITPDPLGFINGPNPYLYCLNNPVVLIDPNGLEIERQTYGVNFNPQGATNSFQLNLIHINFGDLTEQQVINNALGFTPLGIEEAAMEAGENAVAGVITGYTSHGLNQVISRDGGNGVAASSILDAVSNPTSVQVINGTTKYVGNEATVIVNSDGKVVTAYGKPRNSTGNSQ